MIHLIIIILIIIIVLMKKKIIKIIKKIKKKHKYININNDNNKLINEYFLGFYENEYICKKGYYTYIFQYDYRMVFPF